MTDISVAQQVVDALKELGVKHVFGVPSGGWVDYMEAIRTTEGIDFILATHEGGAAFMADVCGRITGAPGVCFGTFGPGATNLATGVGSAYLDRSPMIALTDEMPEHKRGRIVQMAMDHQALFAPITKKTTRLEAGKVREILFDAAQEALSGVPGPVHVGLPVGMSAEKTTPQDIAPLPQIKIDNAGSEQLEKMQQLFTQAKKPVIVLGLRAALCGIQDEVKALAEKFNVPVVINPMAKGILSESHPSYAGVLFHALSDVVGQTHQQADLVVSIGYDEVEFSYEDWMPDAPLVSLDIVTTELDTQQYTLACDVLGDIPHSVQQLLACDCGPKDWDLQALAARRDDMFTRMSPQNDVFGPCAALDTLREKFPQNGIMTCDVGAHIHLIGQKWPTPKVGLQIMTNGWSAMGFGIPSAIAAKLCNPETPVCSVVGDGGFLMTAGELAVAVRENLSIVFVLFTDNDLALIRIKQEKKSNPIYGTPIRERGTIGGDNIFGVPVLKAFNQNEYGHALEKAQAMGGPVIVEAILDSREYDDLVLRKDRG
ncbi:thiamine pyrophosphate-binding protein [Lacimicrobium alkaliphilum]|uniref:Acetolactate synthase n=1 Tax=Lacimicrobium alkaliphilum TaxID=1526571 RepID=A0ABQ1R7F4_9ALTE|nr:thiamine pyrophosphate-binding protein [Lacimicrobium alkaliphilum]GGD61167.1 acetolactate synthase [Lacimicrobium alkaliphilum]